MLMILVILFAYLAVAFLIDAGIVALLCWGLKAIGITMIGSWTVAFSWPLVIIFWLVTAILGSIFKAKVEVKK